MQIWQYYKPFNDQNFSVLTPVMVNALEKKHWFRSRPWLSGPTQMLMCGFILLFATPLCCALVAVAPINESPLGGRPRGRFIGFATDDSFMIPLF
ncbi:MAG: hypothetical protein HC896_15205 [Bacteroidales bacterium]|nr:hypothetical protein [Bacteroidales bacterium]